ncbi:MAG: acyl-CoA desaturase [Planctomycetota bacterium]|nr:acyl-CoA desaturase [Planctomycetota bacterium]
MTHPTPHAAAPRTGAEASDPLPKIKFAPRDDFRVELRRRVEAFLETSGRRSRDCSSMYMKTAIMLAWFVTSYVLLVFVAWTWWQGLGLAVLLGLAASGIGFGIQHDGGHGAYSARPWINKLMALSLDLLGGSSYLWHWKHVSYHHTYVNITGHDTDIDLGGIVRLTPHQPRLMFHRWQHWYIWPLYGFMAIRWHLFSDFQEVIAGKMGGRPFPRPRNWDLVAFIAGKVIFVTIAFGIPLLVRPVWIVAMYYVVATLVLGIVLSIVFQLAHCVEEAEFPMPEGDSGKIENAWAIHQVETTVDFARRSRFASWLLGGLNFQIEHHLFPRICHVHYPAISKVVEQTCLDYGVKYNEHKTFLAGVASHFRWLRRMGAAAPRA